MNAAGEDDAGVVGSAPSAPARGWTRVLAATGSGSLLAMMVVMVADVVGRKFFNHPILGAVEVVERLLLVTVYAGIPLVTLSQQYIRLELVDDWVTGALAAWRRRLGEWFCAGLLMACAALVAHHAIEAMRAGDTTTLLRIPLWPFYAAVALLLMVTALAHVQVSMQGSKAAT